MVIVLFVKVLISARFLLVRFQIEAICKKTTPRQILKELDNLKDSPEGLLDRTYGRVMDDLRKQPESCELALKVFAWLVRAGRPLTLSEMRVAVSVEPDRYELDELDYPDPMTLLDVCGGLVTIDEETDGIRLAHYTVQEYLVQHAILPNAEFNLARACITYLSFDEFAKGHCESPYSFSSRIELFPLLEYAVDQLSFHLNTCDQNLTTDMVLRFLGNSGSFLSYSQVADVQNILSFHGWYWNSEIFEGSTLQLACSIGHLPAVLKLLEQATADEISAQNNSGETALHRAVRGNHEAVVRVLLERGADLSLCTNWLETPLHHAANWAYETVLGLLIEKGADISAQNTQGRTPLHGAASRKGDPEAVVRFLLDKGADHSALDESGETVLHSAVSAGNEAVVKTLLEKGADILAQTKTGGTALYFAARASNWVMVQVLLEKGADNLVLNERGEAALHGAAQTYRANGVVIKILIEGGADVSAQTKSGETALHFAIQYENEAALRVLLENGADHSIPDGEGKTALHLAALSGNETIVKMLLENGALVSVVAKDGATPLHNAADHGYKSIVQFLLEKGADHSALDYAGKTPLDYAILRKYHAQDETIQLLREKGAILTQGKAEEQA